MTDTTPVEATEPVDTPSEAESTNTPSTPTTGQTDRTVQLGDRVSYKLSEYDVQLINSADPAGGHRNPVYAGQDYPAIVTAVFSVSCANLRVILDGAGEGSDYWATSRQPGDQPSQWHA